MHDPRTTATVDADTLASVLNLVNDVLLDGQTDEDDDVVNAIRADVELLNACLPESYRITVVYP
jgi:hypothetical protein